jgi:hypothetical protein
MTYWQCLHTCARCGVEYRGSKTKIYCTPECQKTARREAALPPKACEVCGAPTKARNLRTCSMKCAGKIPKHRLSYPVSYSPETKAIVAELWAEGISISQIAAQLDTNKNRMSGLIHRMNLPARAPRTVAPKVKRIRVRALPSLVSLPKPEPRPKTMVIVKKATPAILLAPVAKYSPFKTCQYVYGENRQTRFFCGDVTIAYSPYCLAHHKRCYRRREDLRDDLQAMENAA